MRVVYRPARGDAAELDVEVRAADATIADLAEVLGENPDAGLTVGPNRLPPDLPLADAGLHDGVDVRNGGHRAEHAAARGVVELRVVGGVVAGARVALGAGEHRIGRDATCDVVIDHPTISTVHCRVVVDPAGAVQIVDEDSHNGTWVEGVAVDATPARVAPGDVVRTGAVLLTVVPARSDDRSVAVDPLRHASLGGTVPFNRPPRPAPAPALPPIAVPAARPKQSRSTPLSIVAIVAPILMGVAMVLLLHSLYFALFAALSPIMAIGSWLESKRRNKSDRKYNKRELAEELERFEATLVATRAAARARRRDDIADPAEMLRRATGPSVRLWERRPVHEDFLLLHAGTGDVPWDAPVAPDRGDRAPEAAALLASLDTLPSSAVHVDLANGGVVGLVGDRVAALALARSLVCQAAVGSGPADVGVVIVSAPEHVADWDWAKWLPHSRDPSGGADARLLAGDPDAADALLRELVQRQADGRVVLAVLDAAGITAGRSSPGRALLRGDGGPVAGIVLAPTEHELPALCTTVVELRGPHGEASLTRPALGETVDRFLAAGVSIDEARACARSLALFDDPELDVAGAGLPSRVDLLPLLGIDAADASSLLDRWRAAGTDPGLRFVLGVGEDGPFEIDLVRDGPHALIGGTTGSGKSELLRTLVASLATTASPEHLTFVLVDYKGGSAFDECARLPHTVGMVTDLDEHLGARALRCLEAELRYRERRLREAGANDLTAYLQSPVAREQPLPRLLVVIDEFATLKAELPDFVDALVGVAQRGRSLGVHLLLATQRPSGAVSENIKANTNLRIALRVQDGGDSNDIIGTDRAARISRNQAGRAYVRLGMSEIVPIQTALVSARTAAGDRRPIAIAPFTFGRRTHPVTLEGNVDARTDLARLADAAIAAFASSGHPAPRRPWPDPLPDELDLAALVPADGSVVAVALADEPDAQRQRTTGWDLGEGNLVVYGIGGSGTTTALRSLGLALAAQHGPDALHLYAIDMGSGELAALAGLPHVGAIVGAAEKERRHRLVTLLRAELDRRRATGGGRDNPRLIVLIDGYGALVGEHDDGPGIAMIDELQRIIADGPGVGINTAIAADRAGAVPTAVASTVAQKWLFRLADAYDYGTFGIRNADVPALPPGRAIQVATGTVIQVARPVSIDEHVADVVARWEAPQRAPQTIGSLPGNVDVATILDAARFTESPWLVPLGVGNEDLGPAVLRLYDGEHALVAGPARSGRSTALLAAAAAADHAGVATIALAGPRSPLASSALVRRVVDDVQALVDAVRDATEPLLVLIDDADRVDDVDSQLEKLVTATPTGVHVIASGRADALRAAYGHWTRALRRSKTGVLLRPEVDLDGELLGVTLPRRSVIGMVPGRGWLVADGGASLIQVAEPSLPVG